MRPISISYRNQGFFERKVGSSMHKCSNTYLARWCSIFSLLIMSVISSVCHGETLGKLIYIYAEPCGDRPAKKPTFFCYNDLRNSLDSIWSINLGQSAWTRVQAVEIFSNGVIIISEGQHSEPQILHIISSKDLKGSHSIDMSALGYVSHYYYFQEYSGKGKIIAEYMADMTKIGFQYSWLDIESGSITNKSDSMLAGGEMRLSGARNEYAGGYGDDIISFRNVSNIPNKPNAYAVATLFNGSPPSDSIVRMKKSFGWVMVANEPDFRAILSVPDRNGLVEREVLILDRRAGLWSSILIDGAETSLRPINGWLTGVIADPDPETDYAIRKGFPPKLREDVVIINPLEVHQFKVHLGKQSEVLWIEDSTTYYRVGDGLYKAKIRNDDFVERTLLVRDARVKQIHWAFRGSMGDSIR